MKSVLHVLHRSGGGIRRHVRYVALHPPPGYRTAGIVGPAELEPFFGNVAYRVRGPGRTPEADVVHAHGVTAGTYALLARMRPLVVTLHVYAVGGGRTSLVKLAMRAVAPMLMSRADALIAVSADAGRGFRGARVIPPAVDAPPPATRTRAEVRAELGASADDVVVLSVARLHADKALDVLIGAVASTGAVGWIAGDGPLRAQLEARARGTRVRLLGYRDDVSDLLGAADVFALSSVGEGHPIAVVEAIGAGLAVVATKVGAVQGIVGDAGLLPAPGDRSAFASELGRLVRDPELRSRLAAAARMRRLEAPDELVARLGRVYDEVT